MLTTGIFAVLFSIATQTFPIPHVEAATLSKDELQAIAMADATAYHLTAEQMRRMLATITCESSWDINALSSTGDIGIVQISPKYWPQISGMEMLNPLFSLDFMAHQFELGHEHYWVCYNRLYAEGLHN